MFDLPPMFSGNDNIWDEPDLVLQYIVTALVNGMGLEMSVTLMARGLVVSGTLISEATYLDNISNLLKKQVSFNDPDMPAEVRESLQQVLDLRSLTEFDISDFISEAMLNEDEREEMDDEDDYEDYDYDDDYSDMPPELQYLHLRDPLILAGEPPIDFGEGSDIVLRLRLTSIDGWMIGKISPNIPPEYFDLNSDDDVKH
jgi:hypothetical protein